jgi:hypothetical protein
MGTNYYLTEEVCPHCNRGNIPLHIGKSSGGWCFSLHIIPEDGINDLAAWEMRWSMPNARIEDEYGRTVSPSEMMEIITQRKFFGGARGWDSESLRANSAIPGPNGLARHALLEGHCVAHGDGTYDHIVGEFS